jgi:hypothetical protein
MVKATLRGLAGVVIGIVVALALVVAVELFSDMVYPLPEGFGNTKEEMCQHVERYPAWVLAAVVPFWGITALAGTWTAQKIGNFYSAVIVGLLLLAALILNISMLPYPSWFKIANLLVIPVASVAGGRLLRKRVAAPSDDVG